MKRKVIAVTGGIGSGKSTVCRLLEKKGFRVVDCDALSRRVAEQSETLEENQTRFRKTICSGRQSRQARSRAGGVFRQKKTETLNRIFHRKIFALLEEEIARSDGAVFVEIQLLTPDRHGLFDGVWVVTASEETRVKRAMTRDGRSEEQIRSIIERQSALKGKPHRDTKTIVNDGDAAMLEKTVDELLESIDA